LAKYKRYNKYKVSDSAKRSADGVVFASKLEMRVYLFLKKTIGLENFTLQPSFELQPGFRQEGKAIRAIKYVADFLVKDGDEELVVDAKGMVTPVFKIKEKMFKYKFGKTIHLLKTKKDMANFANSLKHIKLKTDPE
tara:strand:+ start:1694 stop:2104 length:411 start_codon:yes stop_codon:yes gene_type:complete